MAAQEVRSLSRLQVTGLGLGACFAGYRHGSAWKPTPCYADMFSYLERAALHYEGLFMDQYLPVSTSSRMQEYGKRSAMKQTREDGFLHLSTTGEQVCHLEPAQPHTEPSVPPRLPVLGANVEPG